ncbi:50S ribosomal protein L11 methyltransferase [Oceanomicrobium pacificus]|uniref:Ribosomal protein L11 methyltransferase n=1 Tax=Oceanomicrobium pacificus TaxID=2692916 RepID=A0A6B0TN71_9RHOB|nr:50S ribosomal protein L11 methyltransferase [Oceanomicrobium pacificus]MXU65306.1 50S ribosomal protein L11 methyltransferase [Oceanomicrobium pacificus]
MPTYTALTTLPGQAAAEALAETLERLEPEPTGIGVFEVEDGSGTWEVGGYFTEKPDVAGLALLATMAGAKPFVVSRVEDRDWVAQVRRELTPVHAGRFVVYGSHDRDAVPAEKIGLEIDAAMAFGTGHHGTTQGCLEALSDLDRAGLRASNIADIGCGTGVLAMGAVKLWNAAAIASDIDPVAVDTARANMAANGLRGRVACVTAPGFRHDRLRRAAPYDLVFANILAGPLKRLAGDMARHVAPGGAIILSGILNRQAVSVERVYEGHGFTRMDLRRIGEWTTFTLRRT